MDSKVDQSRRRAYSARSTGVSIATGLGSGSPEWQVARRCYGRMNSRSDLCARVDLLRDLYGEIGGPASEQWDRLLSIPVDRPVSLINLFAFREIAEYPDPRQQVTGQEAFDLYAAVSAPALEGVGGRFLHFGSHQGNLVGDEEVWDLVVVGEYPDVEAIVALHENPAYREAYRHRVAACADQRVLISA